MRIVHEFRHAFREIEHLWIPMPDGCRLGARLWLPEDASRRPVAAIIEYIPYRKRDGTRERDEAMHRYFAGHGFAALRIDLRGAGESSGVLLDEYLDQEIDDGLAAIEWVAAQDWCNGAIGMIGKSWGGFNALQLAGRRPPALKAVIAVCAADDRYTDDAHYMGGCLLNENLIWGSTLLTINSQPPDSEIVGEQWRTMWYERLEAARLFPAVWLEHQHRDDYWRHGSIREDYGAIACPVLAVGGWADGYSNAVPRLLAHLEAPCRGLVGPWGHVYPHDGRPGPAIGFLQEALRWWTHWLSDADAGSPDNAWLEEPAYRVWLAEAVPETIADVPGRWIAEPQWPSPSIEPRTFYISTRGLAPRPGRARRREIASRQTTGMNAGVWCAFGFEGELPTDQREDDAHSLCFDTPPLTQRIEILGPPTLELELASDRPVAFVVARLNAVRPDGRSERVTYGLLNLTHRDGHSRPRALVPGETYRVRLTLNDVAFAFERGTRIRLALSTAYWPMVWPAPAPVSLSIVCGESSLTLPVRAPRPQDATLRPFEAPESAYADEQVDVREGLTRRTISHDAATGTVRNSAVIDLTDAGRVALSRIEPIGLVTGSGLREDFEIRAAEPLSARGAIHQRVRFTRPGWDLAVRTDVAMRSSATEFIVEGRLSATENGRSAFERDWNERVPRDLV